MACSTSSPMNTQNSANGEQQPSVGLHIRLAFVLFLVGLVFWVGEETWVATQLAMDSQLINAEVINVVDGRHESYDLKLNNPEFSNPK